MIARSGAKAPLRKKGSVIAALKRCATLPGTAVPGFPMPSLRDWAFVLLMCVPILYSGQTFAQDIASAASESKPKADVIFIHANVYTGVPSNEMFGSTLREEAIAVRGERILAVGKNIDIEKLKGLQTQVVDLGGHFVMPGFNDAHLHLADAGLWKLSVDLTGVKTLDEFRERLRAKVDAAKGDEWILGGGWDETLWPVAVLPSRGDLDEVSGGHPVFLEPTREKRRQGIEVALADLAEHGVTSAQDYSPAWVNFQIYEELEKEGKLTARVSEWLPFNDSVGELKTKRDSHPQSDLMLHTGM